MNDMDIKEQAAALGMFPAVKMAEAEKTIDPRKRHAFTCALMDCAKNDGGMIG